MSSSRESGFYRTVHAPKEHRTGLTVILSIVAMVAVVFWFGPGGGDRTETVRAAAVFENVRGLTEGDPVMIAGARVGRVADVTLETAGRVTIEIEVEAAVRPRRDARATVEAIDLLGSKAVGYWPGTSAEWLPEDGVIVGGKADAMLSTTRIREEGARLALRVQDLLGPDLAADLAETRAAVHRAQAALGGLEGDQLGRDAKVALAAAGRAAERFDSLRAAVAIDSTRAAELWSSIDSAAAHAAQVRTTLSRLRARIDSGGGNLGRWQRDTVAQAHLDSVIAFLRRLSK